jgi:hypothetical protein
MARHCRCKTGGSSAVVRIAFARTKGGPNPKPHAVGDERGRPRAMLLTEGQMSAVKSAPPHLRRHASSPAAARPPWRRSRLAPSGAGCARDHRPRLISAIAPAANIIFWINEAWTLTVAPPIRSKQGPPQKVLGLSRQKLLKIFSVDVSTFAI